MAFALLVKPTQAVMTTVRTKMGRQFELVAVVPTRA
jgi:hypothetical protein